MEKQTIRLGGRDILLIIRRNKASKRVSLRLTPAADGVILTLPMRANLTRAMGFLTQKTDWVLKHVTQMEAKTLLIQGTVIPVFGDSYVIEYHAGRGVTQLESGKLLVYGAPEFTARRVKDFLKKHLQHHGLIKAQDMAAHIGKKVRSLRIGDMRSRWGSCTASGALAFNWRLVFAPPEVLEYLIAHEVAHLAEMNHGARFWKKVAELYPDFKREREWLRREGQSLYRYE